MKVLASLLIALACVHAVDFSAVENVHDNIHGVFDSHTRNLWEAHKTIVNVNLQLHRENVIQSLSTKVLDYATQDIAACQSAILNFQTASSACNAVFVVFNNSYTDVTAGHNLMAAHCASGGCHQTLSQAIVAVQQACQPILASLHDNGVAVQNLKTAIVLTEMPCITEDNNPSHFCFEDVIGLRAVNQAPGAGTAIPADTILNQYCTRCIVKLFAAAATFAPDYARVQFELMSANCWRFPDSSGPFCILVFKALNDEDPVAARLENGTSLAHLDKLCHPCVRIFMRRIAILYADPIFMGAYFSTAVQLFRTIHIIDVLCFARAAGSYCIRELKEEIFNGTFLPIYPLPGLPCYDALVSAGTTCPACANQIFHLLTEHGCCAIVLMKLVDLASYLDNVASIAADNRDDPNFPSNKMVSAFNNKCSVQAQQITLYCTAVALTFELTIRNIIYTYYAVHAAEFHALVIADVAEFLGMIAADINVPSAGTEVQGKNSGWISSFVPSSFRTQTDASGGVTLTLNVMPPNADVGASINTYMTGALGDGSIPLNNAASDVSFVADPTVAVTATQNGSTAASLAASLMLVAVLIFFNL